MVERARALWPQRHPDLVARAEFVGGDFFVTAPQADVYFLMHAMHDWDDAPAVKVGGQASAGADACRDFQCFGLGLPAQPP